MSSTSSIAEEIEPDTSSRSSSPVERGRGRGRGRAQRGRSRSRSGRSRGRGSVGRGRGRGRGAYVEPETEEDVLQTQKDEMKEEVNSMDVRQLRDMLCRTIELDPRVMLEVLRPAVRQPGGYHPEPGGHFPDWCVCGLCREMPTQAERKCCGKGRCVSQQASIAEEIEPDTSSRSSSPVERGRGRGRGRAQRGRSRSRSGRSRGRGSVGRGRGRGRGAYVEPETEEDVLQTQKDEMKEEVNSMDVRQLRDMLCRTIELDPRVMLEVLQPAVRQPGGYHPEPGGHFPDWCVCGLCREMPTQAERKCCGKGRCVSQQANFNVLILDEGVLALARLYRRDLLVFEDEVDIRKANRHQAYRQFILWSFGRLGAGDRRVIPSCCVWKIRDKYPDPFGQYTGFVPSRIG